MGSHLIQTARKAGETMKKSKGALGVVALIGILAKPVLARDVCEETADNLAWQWHNTMVDEGCWSLNGWVIKEAKYSTLTILGRVAGVLEWPAAGPAEPCYTNDLLGQVVSGQRENPHVQQVERACFNRDPSTFLELLALSSKAGSDPSDDLVNLRWQRENNRESLVRSLNAWKGWKTTTGRARGKDMNWLKAVYYVLSGQRHNHGVMSKYRASIRADEDRFFEAVEKVLNGSF
ncbi:MAG TPA: hypothetical protein VGF45_13535 [Polyangia bacterium]